MENIQQLIKEIRVEKGMTQKQLAEASHIEQHTLSQYETGKRQLSMVMFEALMGVMGYKINIQLEEIKMENSELKLKSALMAQNFFQQWEEMEQRLPEYDVAHTGGGIYVASKDFTLKDGQVAGVWISDECVVMRKKLKQIEEEGELFYVTNAEGFVTVKEYRELGEHYEEQDGEDEVFFEFDDEKLKVYLNQTDIDEILQASTKL